MKRNRDNPQMSTFDDYASKYQSVHMRREDGILEMRFQTEVGPLRWSKRAHELPGCGLALEGLAAVQRLE